MNEEGQILKIYLETLRKLNKPFYAHELQRAKTIYNANERLLTEEMEFDLKILTDREICEKYKIEPRYINPKYVDKNTKEIKKHVRTINADKIKENFKKQYNNNIRIMR